ncbi:MAG: Na+/H+ antiporter subunit E [Clostridiales bacterium]|nr:Na+/H+ antiporter subunit E [Clostridia bacterium]MCR4883796.1 Na+/H+ antiporter subunit E [Clostridiales bacterium]
MFVVFTALFLVFCGKITLETLLFSIGIAALLFLFCCRHLGYSLRKEQRLFMLIPGICAYVCFLLKEIVLANWQLMHMIYSEKEQIEPCIATFHTSLKSSWLRTALADSITLTPGTISVQLEGDLLTVHCLDKSLSEGLKNSEFEMRLKQLEE